MIAIVLLLICAVGFVVLALTHDTSAIQNIDRSFGDQMVGWRSEILTSLFEMIDFLGTTTGFVSLLGLTVVILLSMRQGKAALLSAACLLSAWLLNTGMKHLIARERPIQWDRLTEADGFSFPSGNAMISAAFYGWIAYLLLRSAKWWIRAAGWGVVLIILLLGLSRSYMGVHYVSDIAAGFFAGAAVLTLTVILYRRMR